MQPLRGLWGILGIRGLSDPIMKEDAKMSKHSLACYIALRFTISANAPIVVAVLIERDPSVPPVATPARAAAAAVALAHAGSNAARAGDVATEANRTGD